VKVGDVCGQASAFGTQRIFHHLHHQVLPLTHQLRNIANGEVLLLFPRHTFGVRHNVRGMKKRGLIQTNIYKSRLHTRQYATDPTLVDIAYYPAPRFTFNVNLLQDTAIDIGHACFRWRNVD
jgi:hypothetical protein